MSPNATDAARYAIVELMGHRRLGARVEEVEFCGAKMLQLTVLTPTPFVQLVSPASLYAVTFCSEEQASKVNTSWTTPEELRPRLGPGAVIERDVEVDDGLDEEASAAPREIAALRHVLDALIDRGAAAHATIEEVLDLEDLAASDAERARVLAEMLQTEADTSALEPAERVGDDRSCELCGAASGEPCRPGCPEGHCFRHPEEG